MSKRTFYILSALLQGFLSFSCSRIDPDVGLSGLDGCFSTSNTVTTSMVKDMLERNQSSTKADKKISQYTVEPYVFSGDTLMYIVQFKHDGGWRILSSDTRVPPILAESESGCFSIEDGSPAVSVWLRNMANDMAKIRASSDEELTFSKEEIENNKRKWGIPSRYQPPEYSDPYGHWEVTSYSETEVLNTVNHMVAKWDQNSPYNELSPFYVDDPTKRAAAGCVAIAGSQVLLYLHSKLGVPSDMFSQGYCVGNTSYFYREFSNATSTVWNQMDTSYHSFSYGTLPEAILIGLVGELVDMHYWEGISHHNSWAFPENLRTNVFNSYGINCSRGSYDSDMVKTNLLNQLPVIVSGSNQLIPVDGNIHCFVIDGFKITRQKNTYIRFWVLDETPPPGYIMPEEQRSISYTSPDITSIKINWGWWSQWTYPYINDGWYALTGGWTVNLDNEVFDYNYNLNMTYGFTVGY